MLAGINGPGALSSLQLKPAQSFWRAIWHYMGKTHEIFILSNLLIFLLGFCPKEMIQSVEMVTLLETLVDSTCKTKRKNR